MRQVGADELVHVIQSTLRRLSKSQVAALIDWRPTERLRGRLTVANLVAAALARFEILTTAPEPPSFGYADLDGVSGAPRIEDEEKGPTSAPTEIPDAPATASENPRNS